MTDELFLFNKPVKLPWLNIDIPLFGFFILSPIILLFLHLNLLFNLTKHSVLLEDYKNAVGKEDFKIEHKLLSPFLVNSIYFEDKGFNKFLLIGLAYFVLYIVPILSFLFGHV